MKKRAMTTYKTWTSAALIATCAIAANIARAAGAPANGAPAKSRIVVSRALPSLDGGHLHATGVEVTYPPAGKSSPHSHPCPVIGYVLAGAVRMQVKGEPEAIYKTGDSFYEAPNGVHQISENASSTEPAKFLAWFICDHDTPLSVPSSQSQTKGNE
jgi:quercetin dioxygenase-like cupin family protein